MRSIFDAVNWPFFLAYALGPSDPTRDDKFEMVITRAESHRLALTPLLLTPRGVLIDGCQISYLTAEEFRQRHGANLTPLAPGSSLRLVGAHEAIFQSL